MKNRYRAVSLFCLVLLMSGAAWVLTRGATEKTHKITTISTRKFADSLHAVIAADREVYSRFVVQRLHTEQGRIRASEDWQAEGCLPVPDQMLRMAATSIQKRGAEFSYTLRSLWPINPSHGPQTDLEKHGLEAVSKDPETPFYSEETLGGRSYFTAVYADRAALSSCVACHNAHPRSPRQDFKLGDVMGAVIVRVPLEF